MLRNLKRRHREIPARIVLIDTPHRANGHFGMIPEFESKTQSPKKLSRPVAV
jgi:hypothetical protein